MRRASVTVEPEAVDALLCAACRRRLAAGADVLDAVRTAPDAWLPRTARAAERMLAAYRAADGVGGGGKSSGATTLAPLPAPWADARDARYAYERAVLEAALLYLRGRDRALPRRCGHASTGAAIADGIVRAAIVDCLRTHA